MVDFTQGPAPQGFFSPERFEADIYDCEVEGSIPPELNGAFYRVGAQWAYPQKHEHDVPFSADGFISSFRINGGKVDFRGRWVKTPRFMNNMRAGEQLYGVYRNPYTAAPEVRDQLIRQPYLGTVMNTAPIAHAGRLFALKEDAHPFEMDPNTLETLGPWDFHGGYKSQTHTAHPKIDPVSGEMITYGYEATGLLTDDLWIYTIGTDGRVKKEVRLKMPWISMLHDIVLTQEHIVIPLFGYVATQELQDAGKVHWGWDGSVPTWWGILPRDGEAEDIRWFKGPTSAVVHTINGRTEGNKVIVEAPISDGAPFPFFPTIDGSRWDPVKARHNIRRLTFDLSKRDDSYTVEHLDRTPITDLARVDDRYLTLPYRYVYTHFNDPSKPFDAERAGNPGQVRNSYFRYDLQTGAIATCFAGDTHSLQELSFVPRSPDSPEGDGWLLGCASNYAEMRTELMVIDAMAMEEVARVYLPFRMTPQVHGRWVGAKELPMVDRYIPEYHGRVQNS